MDTHGVEDFYLLKKRLIAFLVKNYGFNVVVIEDNFPEVTRINEATLQGKGDETLYQKYLTPYLQYCSLFDIINWIRDHNQQTEKKVQLYGMDMQSSKEAIAISTELIRKANDKSLYNDWLDLSRKISDLYGAQQGNKKSANSAVHATRSISKKIRKKSVSLTRESDLSAEEYSLLLRNLNIIESYIKFTTGVRGSFFSGVANRDWQMAINVMEILRQNPNAKIIMRAHNGHVVKYMEQGIGMGYFLHKEYKGDQSKLYTAVGLLSYSGSYLAASGGT